MGRIPLTTAAMVVSMLAATGEGSRAAEPARLTVVALGDSLTSGHRLPESQAYPALLEKRLKDADLPYRVVNHGVSGDTSAGGVRRLADALAEQPQILIIELGANDGLRGVPVSQVRANLETIIEGAQKQGVAVLLCAMDALPVNGFQYTLDFHKLYYDLADKYKVPLVPFLLNGVLGNRDLMSADGVHPNKEGAKVLADTIWPVLRPLAEETAAKLAATTGQPAAGSRQ
jgi:acyl-CoA thioesterase-1